MARHTDTRQRSPGRHAYRNRERKLRYRSRSNNDPVSQTRPATRHQQYNSDSRDRTPPRRQQYSQSFGEITPPARQQRYERDYRDYRSRSPSSRQQYSRNSRSRSPPARQEKYSHNSRSRTPPARLQYNRNSGDRPPPVIQQYISSSDDRAPPAPPAAPQHITPSYNIAPAAIPQKSYIQKTFGAYENPDIEDRRPIPQDLGDCITFRASNILEYAIFDFVKAWIPDLLVSNDWISARGVELNCWGRWIENATIPPIAFAFGRYENIYTFISLINNLKEMRHCYVHRKRDLPVLYLQQMLQHTIDVMTMMKDAPRVQLIMPIFKAVNSLAEILKNGGGGKLAWEDKRLENEQAQAEVLLEYNRLRDEEREIAQHVGDHDITIYNKTMVELQSIMDPVWKVLSEGAIES